MVLRAGFGFWLLQFLIFAYFFTKRGGNGNKKTYAIFMIVNAFLFIHSGAGDNAISCSVMLEMLRVFSVSEESLQHNLIFLFNGAEENLLQVSKPFLEYLQTYENMAY